MTALTEAEKRSFLNNLLKRHPPNKCPICGSDPTIEFLSIWVFDDVLYAGCKNCKIKEVEQIRTVVDEDTDIYRFELSVINLLTRWNKKSSSIEISKSISEKAFIDLIEGA